MTGISSSLANSIPSCYSSQDFLHLSSCESSGESLNPSRSGSFRLKSTMDFSSSSTRSSSYSSLSTQSSILGKQHHRSTSKSVPTIKNYFDHVNKKEIDTITEKLGNFFFGCNIPFNVVTSKHFKDLIKSLRPAYVPHLPGRKKLSTSILDNCYENSVNSVKKMNNEDSVILIDGWKNTSCNKRTVVTMLHTANKQKAFLNAWDITSTAETGDRLAEIIEESIELARTKYNVSVYAAVSDNAANMKKMGNTISIWHTTCKSHTGNLLLKDALDEKLKGKVMAVIKEFKQADFEALLVRFGGSRLVTPGDSRWCSYRNAYLCVVKNIPFMKQVMVDETLSKKVKTSVQKMLVDDKFVQALKDEIALLDPICEVINTCQREDCCIAEGAHMWMKLKLPGTLKPDLIKKVDARKKMALDVYSLAAHNLHPEYYREYQNEMSLSDVSVLDDFFLDNLSANGLISLSQYRAGEGIFGKLFNKNLTDSIAFWTLCKASHPDLANFALKLLKLPASSAQIERLFSQWNLVHCKIRNRLDFERSKKLIHLYYTLKFEDTELDLEDLDEEFQLYETDNIEGAVSENDA